MEPNYYSVREAAETLNVSVQYVRKLLREGRLYGEKIGEIWIIPCESIDDLMVEDNRMKKQLISDSKSKKDKTLSKLNTLSFFSGALGLDIGLEKGGFNVLLACEIDNACRQTIIANDPKIGLIGDLRDYSVDEILEYSNLSSPNDVDVIVGGPPCQAFSTAGKRMGFEDERGNIFLKYLDLIIEIKPKYFVIENVRGLYSSSIGISINDEIYNNIPEEVTKIPGSTLFYIKKKLEANGYNISFNLYNSANFGSPQIRERVVIIGTKSSKKVPYLTPTNSDDPKYGLEPWKTFKEAVKNLPSEPKDYIKFSERRLYYYQMLGPGENWRNLPIELQQKAMGNSYFLGGGKTGFYRRLAWDKPSPTIVTNPAMPATDLCHPTEDRPLSLQEYCRIQEFPEDWVFCGSLTQKYKQVGNAVPVSLGIAIGRTINKHRKGINENTSNGFPYSRYKNTSDTEWEQDFLRRAKIVDMEQLTFKW